MVWQATKAKPIARIVVAAVFMLAAVTKSMDPLATTAAISYTTGIERWNAWIFLHALVLAEWTLGVLLLFHLARRSASLAASALLIVFSGYLILVLVNGSPAGCGCGLWWTRKLPTHFQAALGIVRNAILLVLLVVSSGLVGPKPDEATHFAEQLAS